MIFEQDKLENKIRDICSEWWTDLSIKEFELKEDLIKEMSYIKCDIYLSHRNKNKIRIEGEGKGLVDALFTAITKEFSSKYPSLKGMVFKEFIVKAKLSSDDEAKNKSKTDVPVETTLIISNSRWEDFYFAQTGFSINASSIKAIQKAVELFINSHTAVVRTVISLKDAQKRHRDDLVAKYTSQMSELVKITDYTEVVQETKDEK